MREKNGNNKKKKEKLTAVSLFFFVLIQDKIKSNESTDGGKGGKILSKFALGHNLTWQIVVVVVIYFIKIFQFQTVETWLFSLRSCLYWNWQNWCEI